MNFRSFIRVDSKLQLVEVELSLVPGLPQILFLGLPDAALKESTLRIRSAIRAQGFQLPQAQQILVHVRPNHLRKTSRGLDLAVAAALLWETRQVPAPEGIPIVYGELTLKGEVVRPDDCEEIDVTGLSDDDVVWTGRGEALPFSCNEILTLSGFCAPTKCVPKSLPWSFERPAHRVRTFPLAAARIAEILAAGEHSALFAGAPGKGKSTLAEAIPCWLEPPSETDLRASRSLVKGNCWRPVLRPHHSITPLAMVGGGAKIWAGEIARAHSGVLIMDELLEFQPEIQEALREPMDTGSISIVRAGLSRTFPSRVMVLATTNLCKCGKFTPGPQDMSRCRCRASDRRRMLSRLTGPFADRFAVVAFPHSWEAKSGDLVSVEKIGERVNMAIEFRRARSQLEPNAYIDPERISLSPLQQDLFSDTWSSRRRRNASLRVARTIADLASSAVIKNEHLEEALLYANRGHQILEQSQD